MISSPMQLSLFDTAGVAPFSMALGASASTLTVADFHVAGMDFKIPNVKDAEEVLKVAMEGLATLQRHQAAMRGAWLWGHGEEDISTWYDQIRATVRRDRSNGSSKSCSVARSSRSTCPMRRSGTSTAWAGCFSFRTVVRAIRPIAPLGSGRAAAASLAGNWHIPAAPPGLATVRFSAGG